LIDEKRLVELWKTPYSERYKHVKKIIDDEILPLYNNQIMTLTSMVEASMFKMLKANDVFEIYEALSRLSGALKILESLISNLTNDITKVLTIVLAPKTVIPPELIKS
jgi:hypothetical protein